jgi:branched-chain amino acid transport system substrate-binding protein
MHLASTGEAAVGDFGLAEEGTVTGLNSITRVGVLVAALGLISGALHAATDLIIIGLIIPLSPPGDPTAGQLIRRGAELAIDYYNEKGGVAGGRKLKLSVQDSQGRPEGGVAAYRRLVSEEHAIGVTGFFHSSVNLAANEVAKGMGVPTIGTQTSAAEITSKKYDVAFRTHVIDPVRVSAWLDFIKQKGFKRVSLLAETSDYGVGLVDETVKQNEEKNVGLELQTMTFDRSSTDLTPLLLQVKAFKPHLLINIGVGQPMDLMIEQAATLGITPQTAMLISYDAPVRPQFWQLHPKNGAGLYFIAYYSPRQRLSDLGTWFAKAYEDKYKESPVYSSLNGFGDVAILAQAADHAKSSDPKSIIAALEGGKFTSWAAVEVTFPRAEGVYWHNWSPPVLILHYTDANQDWRAAEVVVEYAGTAAK